MSYKVTHRKYDEADIDVTSFLNLMIVLVPVMLMTLTFSQITVLHIKLPQLSEAAGSGFDAPPELSVEISDEGFEVFYPAKKSIQKIPLRDENGVAVYDYKQLSLVMQEVKKQLSDKRDVLIRSAKDANYQTIVSTMDAVKSYKTVVAASIVEVELFPELSLSELTR